MAIVRHLEHVPLQVAAEHTEVEATYCVIQDRHGVRFLQLDTYGSRARKIVGKKSQSIRLAPEAIKELRSIFARHFGAGE